MNQINHDLNVKPDLPCFPNDCKIHFDLVVLVGLEKGSRSSCISGSVDLVQDICDPKITCYFLAQISKLRDKALDVYHVTVPLLFTCCLKFIYNMALVAFTIRVVFTLVVRVV